MAYFLDGVGFNSRNRLAGRQGGGWRQNRASVEAWRRKRSAWEAAKRAGMPVPLPPKSALVVKRSTPVRPTRPVRQVPIRRVIPTAKTATTEKTEKTPFQKFALPVAVAGGALLFSKFI